MVVRRFEPNAQDEEPRSVSDSIRLMSLRLSLQSSWKK